MSQTKVSEANVPESKKQDWREKYLALVEQHEQQEQAADEKLEQLRRALVRVSLAADGLDPELDKVLAALREQLKSSNHRNLGHRLEVVEEAVLAFDERKKQQQVQILWALQSLSWQLQRLQLKKDIRKQLKQFEGALKDRVQIIQEYPHLLKELAEFQELALGELELKKPGLFEKIADLSQKIKPSKNGAETASTNESVDAPANQIRSESFLDQPSSIHELEQLAEKSTLIFLQLLSGIQLSPSVAQQVDKIKQQLNDGLQWQDLLSILASLRDVIFQSQVAANQEFSRYLISVNQELETICQLATTAAAEFEAEEADQQRLQAAMNSKIQAIESCISEASDLEVLKVEVKDHIQQLRTALVRPDKKPSSISQQIKQLLNQVENLEKEAQLTYARLSEQKQKAQQDSLTALPNRDAYQERSDFEFKRWQRYQNPLALAVVDIDHFKKINDSFGHQVGDKVLKLVSNSIRKRLREVDFMARYGGEEFVILLPQTPAPVALQMLDKLRGAVAATGFHYKNQPVKITVSIGVSEFTEGDTVDGVFERADKALYEAKAAGRNVCRLAQ